MITTKLGVAQKIELEGGSIRNPVQVPFGARSFQVDCDATLFLEWSNVPLEGDPDPVYQERIQPSKQVLSIERGIPTGTPARGQERAYLALSTESAAVAWILFSDQVIS